MITNEDEYQPTSDDLQILREWIQKMPHIIQDYDDTFLASCLKGTKGSLQKAKISLEKLNSLGQRFPEFFGHLDIRDPITRECIKDTIFVPLSKRLEDGTFIIIIKMDFKDSESKKTKITEFWRYWLMVFYVRAWENEAIGRSITIFDWSNLRVGQAREITPVMVKNMVESLKSLPVRMGGLYNVNVSPALQWIMAMIKSLSKKKLGDRMHFIDSMDALQEIVPRELLPKDYGGDQDDIRTIHSRWMKKVEGYRDRLVEENMRMRKLDAIRPKDVDLEMVGTFKALNVD